MELFYGGTFLATCLLIVEMYLFYRKLDKVERLLEIQQLRCNKCFRRAVVFMTLEAEAAKVPKCLEHAQELFLEINQNRFTT